MKRINFKILFGIIMVILIVARISYKNFLNYENTIITQQRKHLMTISKSIGRSLELYVGEKVKGLQGLSDNFEYYYKDKSLKVRKNKIMAGMKKFYITQNKEVSTLIFIDLKKDLTLVFPENSLEKKFILKQKNLEKEISYVKKYKKKYIGTHYLDRKNGFSFNILLPVVIDNKLVGIILGQIKLTNMYNLLVKPIKAGKYGYAVVKDGKGNILMHPVKDQIGYDGLSIRRKKYPNLDYTEIEKLFKKQQSEEEGYYIYYSYWWPQEKLKKVKKINVYSRVHISKDYWIIPVLTSYEEIREPIKNYLYGTVVVSGMIIIVFSWVMFLTVRMINNKQNYELETRYLRELNNSTEELRKKDAELHHRRKLETIGTLTGGIAHEFNNALTPIMGYSEMCLRELNPDLNSYNYVRAIYRSSKRAQEIINQIRVFSGDKNIKIKYESISVNKVIDEAIKFIETMIPSNIKILKDISEKCGNIYANNTQIHQVILNLCTNSYNAMKSKNSGILKISLHNTDFKKDEWLKNNIDQERDYIKITIEDNGCGMEKEILDKIFEPFFTQKLTKKSSGLGLAIVSGIVSKHGGLIYVESQKNIGSKFHLYLPKTEEKTKLKEVNSEQNLNGTEKVLVVDNNEEIVNMLENGLLELGYKVKSIVNSGDILKEFNYIKDHFQIVITDLTMPEVNGIQFAKKLKREKSEIKVILVTAYSEEPLEEYMKLGIIDNYLMKPVTAPEISSVIRKIMSDK